MVQSVMNLFDDWSLRKRLSFGAGLALILILVIGLGWWAQRSPQAVLFANLAERDAGVLAAELDKLKQPYALGEDGRSILVDADAVHRTRMALMSKQLPLNGVVGFELFNNADFGVSDFVQKVNFQRALQGELTRTILSIEQVQDARVHLALPEQTLFRKEGHKGKASVTVSVKGGESLQAPQVAGIQRLVAAAVPELRAEDVTVLNQHGVVLSRAAGEEADVAEGQLAARESLEAHMTRKATKLLTQMFGADGATVVVDAVLEHRQSKLTKEEVLASGGGEGGQAATGVMVRERSSSKELGTEGTGGASQLVNQEVDYQTGKLTEQTVSKGGQILHLNVAVVVKRQLDDAERDRVRQLVAAALGLRGDRGDSVVILARPSASPAAAEAIPEPGSATLAAPQTPSRPANGPSTQSFSLVYVLGALLLLLAAFGLMTQWLRRRSSPAASQALSEAEREALLSSMHQWLEPGARR